MVNKRAIGGGTVLCYGVGGVGQGLYHYAALLLLLLYGTFALNEFALIVGGIAAICLVSSCLLEPLFAQYMSRSKNRVLGKRHGAITLAVFLLSLAGVGVFNFSGDLASHLRILWVAIAYLVLSVFASYFNAPYLALSGELANSGKEKRSLQRTRLAFLFIGVMGATSMLLLFSDYTRVDEYRTYSIISAIALIVCGLITVIGTYNHLPRLNFRAEEGQTPQLLPVIAGLKNKARGIMLGFMASVGATALCVILGAFYIIYVLRLENWQLAIVLSSGIMAAFVAFLIIRSHSKGKLLFGVISQLFGAVVLCGAFALNLLYKTNIFIGLIAAFTLVGFGMGVALVCASSFMQDKGFSQNTPSLSSRYALATISLLSGGIWDIAQDTTSTVIGYSLSAGVTILLIMSAVFYGRFFALGENK